MKFRIGGGNSRNWRYLLSHPTSRTTMLAAICSCSGPDRDRPSNPEEHRQGLAKGRWAAQKCCLACSILAGSSVLDGCDIRLGINSAAAVPKHIGVVRGPRLLVSCATARLVTGTPKGRRFSRLDCSETCAPNSIPFRISRSFEDLQKGNLPVSRREPVQAWPVSSRRCRPAAAWNPGWRRP